MFRFPWGDMHSLNLGWFLQKFNELREDWATAEAGIDGALDAEIQRAEDALSDVFDARDAAAASATAAAGSASAANTSKTAAANSATAAASSATLANQKAAAAGLSEAAAGQSATAAGNSATAAATSATQAGQSATNAAGSAATAATDALISEGYAKGSQNGTDVGSGSPYYQNNAKYFKEEAEAAYDAEAANALISEGFATGNQNGTPVTSGSPYYQNNAKYFKDMIAADAANLMKTTFAAFFAEYLVGSGSATATGVTATAEQNKITISHASNASMPIITVLSKSLRVTQTTVANFNPQAEELIPLAVIGNRMLKINLFDTKNEPAGSIPTTRVLIVFVSYDGETITKDSFLTIEVPTDARYVSGYIQIPTTSTHFLVAMYQTRKTTGLIESIYYEIEPYAVPPTQTLTLTPLPLNQTDEDREAETEDESERRI